MKISTLSLISQNSSSTSQEYIFFQVFHYSTLVKYSSQA